jgi:hypothetical protein
MKIMPLKDHPKFLKNSNKVSISGNKVLRFPVFYRVDTRTPKPGDPDYCGTYTPPAPYGTKVTMLSED